MVDLLPGELIVPVEISLILLLVLFIIAFIFLNLKKKDLEEVHVKKIVAHVHALKEGKKLKSKEVVPKLAIKKEEHSLKSMLVKKFSPKIEEQLGSKIEVIDFNAKGENFLVLVEISKIKILLTLDSSGKIIDYKKLKQK